MHLITGILKSDNNNIWALPERDQLQRCLLQCLVPACRDHPHCGGSGGWEGEEEHQGHVHTEEEWTGRSRASPWRPWDQHRLDVRHWWPLVAHCTMCWEEEWAGCFSGDQREQIYNQAYIVLQIIQREFLKWRSGINRYLSWTRLNKRFVAAPEKAERPTSGLAVPEPDC